MVTSCISAPPAHLRKAPIEGVYAVDVDGFVNLGGEYGKVRVVGMTADEAQNAVLTRTAEGPSQSTGGDLDRQHCECDRDPRSGPNRFEVSGRGSDAELSRQASTDMGRSNDPNRQKRTQRFGYQTQRRTDYGTRPRE